MVTLIKICTTPHKNGGFVNVSGKGTRTMENLSKLYSSRWLTMLGVLATLLFAATSQANANSVTIVSNGSVTFLDSGNCCTDFSSAFTTANFSAAQTGTAAFLISAPLYSPAIAGTSWIGTNASAGVGSGDTALYAISFTLPSAVSSASFNLSYYVDNALGDTNAGVYINGTALPGSTGIPCGPGAACGMAFVNPTPNSFTDGSIGSLLHSGTNWLYVDGVNLGAEAGLDFSAIITYTPVGISTTPEPSSVLLLATGLLACGLLTRRFTQA
jgi:hypothetical protein